MSPKVSIEQCKGPVAVSFKGKGEYPSQVRVRWMAPVCSEPVSHGFCGDAKGSGELSGGRELSSQALNELPSRASANVFS